MYRGTLSKGCHQPKRWPPVSPLHSFSTPSNRKFQSASELHRIFWLFEFSNSLNELNKMTKSREQMPTIPINNPLVSLSAVNVLCDSSKSLAEHTFETCSSCKCSCMTATPRSGERLWDTAASLSADSLVYRAEGAEVTEGKRWEWDENRAKKVQKNLKKNLKLESLQVTAAFVVSIQLLFFKANFLKFIWISNVPVLTPPCAAMRLHSEDTQNYFRN